LPLSLTVSLSVSLETWLAGELSEVGEKEEEEEEMERMKKLEKVKKRDRIHSEPEGRVWFQSRGVAAKC